MVSETTVVHRVLGLICQFFFQAEDGIRELVRSRGLGDVYKRQINDDVRQMIIRLAQARNDDSKSCTRSEESGGRGHVSYTHLTLPTSDLV